MKRLFAVALALLLALLLLPLGMFSVAGAYHAIYALPDEIVVEGTLAFQVIEHPMDGSPSSMFEIPAELTEVTIIPLVDNAAFRYLSETYSFGEIDDGTIGIFTLATSGENPTPPSLAITQKPVQNYTLTIDTDDGSAAPVTVTQAMKSAYALPVPERDGYAFNGWVLSGGGGLSGRGYIFGASDGAVTAQWRKLVTISYDADGGSPALEPRILMSGVPDYLPPAPTKSGHTFTGWKAGDTIFGAGASYTVTDDVTFTAQWKTASEEGSCVIANPYEDVVWSGEGAWGAYKGNLHTHTTFSDGSEPLQAMVEEYYAQGYDVIANTDHGVVSKPWDQKAASVFPMSLQNIGNSHDVLSGERLEEITEGAGRGNRGMLQVPMGIELNAATVYKNHVVGLYGGYGQGWIGYSADYRTVIAGTQRSGGVTFIAHPGDWLGNESNPAVARDPAIVNFYADILRDYGSCLGIEIYNSTDGPTRQDRILWDQLLMRLSPEKRPVWGFAVDDSHNTNAVGNTATIHFMPANTIENVRASMETGAFLACSRRDRIRLPEFTGDKNLPFPGITNIIVEGNTITLEADEYCTEIEWIADGEVVGTGPEIDLTDERVTCYVRAQLIGPGGITATQPFGVDKGDGYTHPDDALQGMEKFMWYAKLYLTKNVFGFLAELIMKQFN